MFLLLSTLTVLTFFSLANCEDEKLIPRDDPNSFDIWNPDLWLQKNNEGILPGEIKFCYSAWRPITLVKNHPLVTYCNASDVVWLSYQIHLQKFYKNQFQQLNDHFAVVVTYGDECKNPKNTIIQASQADCHNHEEQLLLFYMNTSNNESKKNKNFLFVCIY